MKLPSSKILLLSAIWFFGFALVFAYMASSGARHEIALGHTEVSPMLAMKANLVRMFGALGLVSTLAWCVAYWKQTDAPR